MKRSSQINKRSRARTKKETQTKRIRFSGHSPMERKTIQSPTVIFLVRVSGQNGVLPLRYCGKRLLLLLCRGIIPLCPFLDSVPCTRAEQCSAPTLLRKMVFAFLCRCIIPLCPWFDIVPCTRAEQCSAPTIPFVRIPGQNGVLPLQYSKW